MGKWLIRFFVKDPADTKNPKTRDQYGRLAGVVGIVTNAILSLLKIGSGLLFNSISIIADGINNLADASSSVILLVGVKLSAKPPDADHPYGHARIEYITGLIISFLILLVGFQLLLQSIDKIRFPEPVEFHTMTVVILLASIGVKIWQAVFNLTIAKKIKSTTIRAAGADSRNDVLATLTVLVGLLVDRFFSLHLDGVIGALVALFIMYSGLQLILEASTPLLGAVPDPDLVEDIRQRILQYPEVLGIHDLVVHNYGPGRIFASVHIEVDAKGDLIASHDAIDNIERTIFEDLSIELVAHMDPLDIHDPLTVKLREDLARIIAPLPGVLDAHDLRVVSGYTHHNLIFDVLISPDCSMTESDLQSYLEKEIQKLSPNYFSFITVDRSYT